MYIIPKCWDATMTDPLDHLERAFSDYQDAVFTYAMHQAKPGTERHAEQIQLLEVTRRGLVAAIHVEIDKRIDDRRFPHKH